MEKLLASTGGQHQGSAAVDWLTFVAGFFALGLALILTFAGQSEATTIEAPAQIIARY